MANRNYNPKNLKTSSDIARALVQLVEGLTEDKEILKDAHALAFGIQGRAIKEAADKIVNKIEHLTSQVAHLH